MTVPRVAPPEDWLLAPTLQGAGPGSELVLEALGVQHAADLQAGADEATVRYLARGGPLSNTAESWAEYIGALNALPARVNWAVLWSPQPGAARRAVGRISFSEVRPADGWLEIGTMLVPAAQGRGVNQAAKLLLMTRAFEVLGAGRVHFKVDASNARSRRAMQKLGAVEEGTLRHYQIRPDGTPRDSVIFSVLRGEWPQVRAGLLAGLADPPPGGLPDPKLGPKLTER